MFRQLDFSARTFTINCHSYQPIVQQQFFEIQQSAPNDNRVFVIGLVVNVIVLVVPEIF